MHRESSHPDSDGESGQSVVITEYTSTGRHTVRTYVHSSPLGQDLMGQSRSCIPVCQIVLSVISPNVRDPKASLHMLYNNIQGHDHDGKQVS